MDYSTLLNDRQYEAVIHTEGPLLIIAGAGSGKTRVLTYRIAYLLEEAGVRPWNIMAITFTNKAANEMRERINKIVGSGADSVWVSTFHSACARILRAYIDRIGYTNSFSIYDTDDSKQVIKGILSNMNNIDPKKFTPKMLSYIISDAKNHGLTAKDKLDMAYSREDEICAEVYRIYEETLFKNNALDFDDLLLKTIELFERAPEVLEGYQDRLRYIMIDEYQDTNSIQFKLVKMLSDKHRNICVVGDDDQSIYKFRGADIRNILDFEKVFPDAKVVKLEQNYRSTKNILNAANTVIVNNTDRKSKKLWTENEEGEALEIYPFYNGYEEAQSIVRDIERRGRVEGYDAFAILYRTNAQSRLFEEQLIYSNIPYRLVGGVNFYSRKEIKDVLAYLKTIDNGRDEIAINRIINIPRRGIGAKSIEKASDYAVDNGIGLFEAFENAQNITALGRAAAKILDFVLVIKRFRTLAEELSVKELIELVLKETGYLEALENEDTDEARERIANIDEFISKAEAYTLNAEEPSLSGFLQDVALVAEIDNEEEDSQRVTLMTLHSAKGLEFDNVYIVGLEEGIFPSYRSMSDFDDNEMQEERRLFYVGITRARKTLKLTYAKQRMMHGNTEFHAPSPFIEEVPDEVLSRETLARMDGVKRRKARSEEYYSRSDEQSFFAGSSSFGSYSDNSFHAGVSTPRAKKQITPKNVPYGKSIDLSTLKAKKPDSLDYTTGDRIRHKKFGEGTVTNIADGGRDFEVTVVFDDYGQKKLFAAFAKLEKL